MSRKRVARKSRKRSSTTRKATSRKAFPSRVATKRKPVSQKTREKLSRALKKVWKSKSPEEKADHSARVSAGLKAYWKAHATPLEKAWGRKLVEEEKKERKKIRTEGLSIVEKGIAYLERLQDFLVADSNVDSAVNADGSVDVEIRISVPRGEDGRSMLLDLADKVVVPHGWWIAVGWIFSPSADMTDEERANYERFYKLLQVHTHYQQSDRKSANIVGALKIYDSLEESKRRKPEQFYIRIHWSPEGIRP